MSCWDRARISPLNSLGMPGVNSVLWVSVRVMYFLGIAGGAVLCIVRYCPHSVCRRNPKYLHSKLRINVCGVGEDLTEMNGSDISLRAISALFQYSGSFRNL